VLYQVTRTQPSYTPHQTPNPRRPNDPLQPHKIISTINHLDADIFALHTLVRIEEREGEELGVELGVVGRGVEEDVEDSAEAVSGRF
jgi:hypothetical protein